MAGTPKETVPGRASVGLAHQADRADWDSNAKPMRRLNDTITALQAQIAKLQTSTAQALGRYTLELVGTASTGGSTSPTPTNPTGPTSPSDGPQVGDGSTARGSTTGTYTPVATLPAGTDALVTVDLTNGSVAVGLPSLAVAYRPVPNSAGAVVGTGNEYAMIVRANNTNQTNQGTWVPNGNDKISFQGSLDTSVSINTPGEYMAVYPTSTCWQAVAGGASGVTDGG